MQPEDDLGAISIKGHHRNGRYGASQNVEESQVLRNTIESLRAFAKDNPSGFGSVLLDPPWQFTNRTGKMAPEHRRLHRYSTLKVNELAKLPMGDLVPEAGHIYLWCPNALLGEGLHLLEVWGFTYKTNLVWHKIRKDGGSDGRGVGFYFRNVTELVLFGVKGKLRTLDPGRTQTNLIAHRKREHSWKPPAVHEIVERCSPGPHAELFAREVRQGWHQWGNELYTYEEVRKVSPAYALQDQ